MKRSGFGLRHLEPILTAFLLTFLTHLVLEAGLSAPESDVFLDPQAPLPAVEELDPLRAELQRLIREDLQRLGHSEAPAPETEAPDLPLPESGPLPPAVPEIQPDTGRSALQGPATHGYFDWLQSLPAEMVSLTEAGPLRRFARTLLALAVAAFCWLAGSMSGLFVRSGPGHPETVLWGGALLLVSCLPVFCLSVFGYGSLVLAGAGAGILGGLLADGHLGVRALFRPLPDYLLAAYGQGHRWAGEGERWRFFGRSLDYQLLRPKLSAVLALLRSRLPLLLGAVIVAELALDGQGLSRTFNNFDQQALHGSFLTGVLLCFLLIRLYSWILGRLEIRLDPVLAQRPTWDAGPAESLQHQPDFDLTRAGERRFVVLGLFACLAVAIGQGWFALVLGLVAWQWAGTAAFEGLGRWGKLGLLLVVPFAALSLLPSVWLEGWVLGMEMAASGRRMLVATAAVLLTLRPLLRAELRGGIARQATEGLVQGLEALPQVLAAVILLRLAWIGVERLGLESVLLQQSLMGLVYGLFGVAFLRRAAIGPLGSVRQQRHVRCSRALGLGDREVLSELFQGRMRRSFASVAALVASMAILLDLYVGFVFERTLTTGGGYATTLGQVLVREDLGADRGWALVLVVACLAGLQLLRAALEEEASA